MTYIAMADDGLFVDGADVFDQVVLGRTAFPADSLVLGVMDGPASPRRQRADPRRSRF